MMEDEIIACSLSSSSNSSTNGDSDKCSDASSSTSEKDNESENDKDINDRSRPRGSTAKLASGGVANADRTNGAKSKSGTNSSSSSSGNEDEKEVKVTTSKHIEGNVGPLTATVKFINPFKNNWINADRLNELRKKVSDAAKHHRVFLVRGSFHTVRRALVERGWVEKLDGFRAKPQANTSSSGFIIEDLIQQLPERKPGESRKNHIVKCERSIMSRFLEHTPIDLLWTARREKADWIDMTKNASLIINRFNKAPFTTKEGLCSALHDFHWFYEEGMSETYFPRCYNVWNPEELNEFVENFRLTASMGLLKWLIETHAKNGMEAILSDDGKVPGSCINFAVSRCKEYLDYCLHNDIDIEDDMKIWDHDWDVFLTHHYLLTHESARIQLTKDGDVAKVIEDHLKSAVSLLEQIKNHWPQYALDGFLNIWIVKPGNKCRGRGIHLMNNIKQIITMVNPPIVSKTRYVIQKYIERPLIIHNTKFDIRQWFMITSVQPLIIWFYKESYLRFSSQQYNLMNYHESVHLTNHAIQKKYHNAVRDERLPHENMWDCHTFQAYLRQIGKYEMWSDRIYPGMQKAIIGTLLACQENMDRRPNTFELYGADFMITEDFFPWLIEINSSPDLAPSTSVTARLCPQCVEDTIRVVIDRRHDPNAATGSFELIYKQVIPKTPAYMGLNLQLRGHRITPKVPVKKDRIRILPVKPVQQVLQVSRMTASAVPKPTTGPVIMDLLECLQFDTKSHLEDEDGRARTSMYRKAMFSPRPNLRYDFAKKKSYIFAKTGDLFRRNGGPRYLTENETYIDNIEDWERATTSFFQHNYANTLKSLAVGRPSNTPTGNTADMQQHTGASSSTSNPSLRCCPIKATLYNPNGYCDEALDSDQITATNNENNATNNFNRYIKLTPNTNKVALTSSLNNFYTLGLCRSPKNGTPGSRSPRTTTRAGPNLAQSTEDLVQLGNNS
ncbi:tubulin glycylase 3A-like [Uranotaenia lowii]|uniref:tubulin glycylase 3A-like n=1 Tax=Uranotaenia lowii TaxID=190385 RepID=UPI00247A7678|nr:tubulin glycylase 3A-like [Uranotaenia lowii]XP_055599057.1 tubulin glycylase 3A-like [Uranotaenia lowii]XP_055599058.1 tubulin glycylase 3A-like [Uranotaenia lowii]